MNLSTTRPTALYVFLFALAMHVAGTWLLPLVDRDEPRFAEASREMLERRDWVVPYFNNQYRFDKPPLTYWAEAASFRAFGESDWAARLPSVLAAALTALAIYYFGRRAVDERTGFWAAIIYTTSLQVLVHSKLCVADPWLVLFVTVAAWAGWEVVRAARGAAAAWPWQVLFVAALALGFLAKGPVAWLPLGMLAWARIRRLDRAPGWLAIPAMLAASAALVMIWAWPALRETRGAFFRVGIEHHVVERGLTGLEGHGARGPLLYVALLPFYFVTVFASFFPWSIRLPWLIKRLRTARPLPDDFGSYLLSGVVMTFALFTFYTTRLPHYTLPAFPLLSLLLAREWVSANRPLVSLRNWAAAMVAVNLIAAFLFAPWFRAHTPAIQLAQSAAPLLKPNMEFASTDFTEPSLVWYFRRTVHGFHSDIAPDKVPSFMAKPGPRFCILPITVADRLFPTLPQGWKIGGEVSGFNPVKGRAVQLRLYVKPE